MLEFAAALRSGRILLMDGAMGTELLRNPHAPCAPVEQYNLIDPETVRSIHASYLDAGADVLLTNTFQANPNVLARGGSKHRLHEIWNSAIALARVDHSRQHYVLADIGPLERVTSKAAATLFAECVKVDGILLETWSSPSALSRFLDQRSLTRLPILVSFTFQRAPDLRTFQGARPELCARTAECLGVAALGANCGKEIGMDDMLEIVKRYRDASGLPIFIKPNAGSPPKKGANYPRTPATIAAGLVPILAEGIAMVGGCCGTTPGHIRALRKTINEWER